jgi:hypothetical protein
MPLKKRTCAGRVLFARRLILQEHSVNHPSGEAVIGELDAAFLLQPGKSMAG